MGGQCKTHMKERSQHRSHVLGQPGPVGEEGHFLLSTPHGGRRGFPGTPPNFAKQTGISAAPGPCNPGPWFPCANSSLPHHPCVLVPAADTALLLSVLIAGRLMSVPAWPRLGGGRYLSHTSLPHIIYRHEWPSARPVSTEGGLWRYRQE